MVSPASLQASLVEYMRSIPELVTAMQGDPGKISAYLDTFPQSVQLWQAISDLVPPAMLVVWSGTSPGGRGLAEVWVHEFSIVVRSKPELSTETGVADIWNHFVNGIPSIGCGQKMIFTEVDSALHRMETPSIRRMSLPINERDALDYFEIAVRFVEKGA